MSQINGPTTCDYCHQRPKFLPYDYCSKTCGSLATAIRTQGARNPAICKQCNQRPVHQNHHFCGRKCANAWAATQRQINVLGYLSGMLWSSPWNQNQQTARVQGGGQPGQAQAAIQGFVNGVRSLISPPNQPQQQQVLIYPVQLQQPPNSIVNPISNAGSITTNPPTAVTLPATSNRGNNNQPGPFNGARQISSLPIQSASRGAPAPQILTTTNVYTTQTTRPSATGMSLVSRSAQSLSYASEPDDANPELTGRNVDSERDLSEDGGGQYGREESVGGEADVQSIGSALPPRSVDACMLEGCSNPTFVDSITDLESEYCSWKHQKEAIAVKQAESCIMCHKMPRGPTDYFCSTRCLTRAMSRN